MTKSPQRRMVLTASAVLGLMLALGPAARADDRPIKLVVGFAAGGTTDVLARFVAKEMGAKLGRTFIVENRPGASGNIAAQGVAQSAADGSTLLFVPSSHATNASLYKKLPFDTINDFASVGLVASTPYVLMINPQIVQAKNVAEFIAMLKAEPGRYQYASAGQGTGQHLSAELFKKMAGADMTQVPYKGSSAAFPDLMGGRVPIMFDNIAVMLPHIRNGPLKALAITSMKRSPLLPDVPTMAETLPDYEVVGWFAVLAPAKTPAKVIQEYNAALTASVADAAFKQKLGEFGAEPMTGSPAMTDKYIRQEMAKWGEIIRQANISLD